MATAQLTTEVNVELRVNGEPFCGALVVGPEDALVLNLGPRAALVEAVEFLRRWLRDQPVDISSRTVFVAAEDMAVIRARDADDGARVDGRDEQYAAGQPDPEPAAATKAAVDRPRAAGPQPGHHTQVDVAGSAANPGDFVWRCSCRARGDGFKSWDDAEADARGHRGDG